MKIRTSLALLILFLSIKSYANLSFYEVNKKYLSINNNSTLFNCFSNTIINEPDLKDELTSTTITGKLGSIYLYHPEAFLTLNTDVPHSYNDGNIWQGRGLNSKVSFGMEYINNFISLRLYPEFWVAENRDFDIISTQSSSGYGDYWTVFDNLQRFGDDPFYELTLGQSDFRLYYENLFTFGISNENISIGPGIKNNIILGSHGATFPHIDFGTLGFVPFFSIGEIEYRILYGLLEESDFFDNDSSNDYGWYSGVTTGFKPGILPNLTFGFNHYYTKPLKDWETIDLLRHIPGVDTSNSGTDLKDTVVSLTFNFNYPSHGFIFYGEIARNDHFGSIENLWRDPEHTSGYTLGVRQKLYKFSDSSNLVISFEHTDLMQRRTRETGEAGPWYRHSWAGWKQGYSHKGQLLGSSIGPGSNSQWLELSYIFNKGIINLSFQRIAHDKDFYYHLYPDGVRRTETDVRQYTEGIFGIDALYKFNSFDIYSKLAYNPHYYPGFKLNDTIHNIHCELGFNYRF